MLYGTCGKNIFHVIVWLFWSTAEAVTIGIGMSDPLETLWTLGANRSRSFVNGLQTCQTEKNTMPLTTLERAFSAVS